MSFTTLLYRYLPHQCPLCLAPSNHYLCGSCWQSLPVITFACSVCGLPLPNSDAVCGDCLQQAKPYEQTICPLLYRHPVDTLLREFKNRRPLIAAQALVPHLLASLHQRYHQQSWPELLIPIPIHWTKALSRGFNQAQTLSRMLSQQTGIAEQSLLRRPLRLSHQKSLTRKRRFANLKRAFVCDISLKNRHVAVVDDVVTSCATVMAAADTLKRAGADQVDIWALARTPSH